MTKVIAKWYDICVNKYQIMEMIDVKRVISIALVALMIFALTVSASALVSPGQKDYYKIEVDAVGKGHATKSTDKIQIGSDGTVTFNAYEDGGFFTKWIIDGKYDVLSGDEYADIMVIKPGSNIKAVAYFSEEKDYLNVFVSVDPEGYGEAHADPKKVKKNSDGTVTLTASGINGGVFNVWTLSGDYDIVSGDLNSDTLVIRPYTDIYAVAHFTKPGETPTEPDKGGETPDNGPKSSPKTGYPLFLVFGLLGLALIGGVVATKKITG